MAHSEISGQAGFEMKAEKDRIWSGQTTPQESG
jgi:hypothetical protein